MKDVNVLNFISKVLKNIPNEWKDLTTHRLDIYDEKLAKTKFLSYFEILYKNNDTKASSLVSLPTAYDYIRLGHPLSCILEWFIARKNNLKSNSVISFSSRTIPVLAILRKNLLDNKMTQIAYVDKLPEFFDINIISEIYGYQFSLKNVNKIDDISKFNGSSIFISEDIMHGNSVLNKNIDFLIGIDNQIGSILIVNGNVNQSYISEIQHVRRRESIAMTPHNCLNFLNAVINKSPIINSVLEFNKKQVLDLIRDISSSKNKALVASSGLSIQYAIMMGLIHHALDSYNGRPIRFIVPSNCYGGTNDQARRVANCIDSVEVIDLLVDSGKNMVKNIDIVLNEAANEGCIPYIIAEIPTNPRVEVPDLVKLESVLSKKRFTKDGLLAIDPVFILDQTFCPNFHFLGNDDIFSKVKTISYVSGSKFPSGGQCTAGYCIGNDKAAFLFDKIEQHLDICDNEATSLQYNILARQMPSMNKRIINAYKNTNEFVSYIREVLPSAKINFVSNELARQGFTPSVFSLDLPSKNSSSSDSEEYKRKLNHILINLMISKIPNDCKYCVSYGQLKGSYWTIPATSTQGTTKEGDKDYIVRASFSADIDLELHKKIFLEFTNFLK